MPTGPRVGVWLFPAAPADRLVEAVVAAERCGLDEVWIADEGVAREPMALLAAAARETTTIGLAVGITSPVLRHAGALAATASTIDELSAGRMTLGLGLGGEKSLAPFDLQAAAAERPLATMTGAIATARAVLGGREGGGYHPPDHAAPPRPVPIFLGARGPKLVALAARAADGIFVSGCSADQHDRVAAIRAEAVTRGHRPVGIALYQSASDHRLDPSVSRWNDVADVLAAESARFSAAAEDPAAPTSVGINLVDLLDPTADPVAAVERAALALGR